MRVTQLFTKTRKDAPADEVSKNAQLLIKAGFIHKEMAGVYSFLPLGLRVLDKISAIVREEMNAVDGQELQMTALQLKERYELTERWSDEVVDNWFKTTLANGSQVGLGFTHEENVTPIVKEYVNSYKELPVSVYQIQTKFRNELRSKSGIMRGREFLMKDMYSFALNQEQHDAYYERVKAAYHKVYERLGIGDQTFITFASGGSFSKYSHEFQTLSEAGEDTLYLDRDKKIAVNEEVYTDEVLAELGLDKAKLEQVKAIEVGNIFSLGTKFTAPFNFTVDDENGQATTPIMGCYGIGISRAMGTIAELLSDDRGLVWPENVAPYTVYLARLGESEGVVRAADELYHLLKDTNIEVLYDDRDVRPGEKFADADLMGIPHRLVISEKTVAEAKVEYKARTDSETTLLTIDAVLENLTRLTKREQR